MKNLHIFILITFLPNFLFCQSNLYESGYRAISLTGLNIRKLPSIKSEIIGGIPFLDQVQILSERNDWKRDTIGINKFYNPHGNDYNIPISGNWLKVKYAEIEGFVFSPYLANIDKFQKNSIEKVNAEYGLNFPGQLCSDNIHRNKKLKWFGLYETPETGKYFLEQIEVDYNITDSEYTWLNILGGKKGLLLMFGVSDLKKVNKHIDGEFFNFMINTIEFINYRNNCSIYTGDDLSIEYDKRNWIITLKNNGRTQILNPESYNLSTPDSLVWRGDIDGDNMDDYIIKYGEKVIQIVLYLSSEAKDDELVKPVAVFYTGYCC